MLERTGRRGLIVLAVLSAIVMLWWPLSYDQGVFATNGHILVRGGEPYRDAWETRGPLAFYLFAAVEWIFGRGAWPIRLLDIAIAAGTAFLLRHQLRHIASQTTADVAAGLWMLFVSTLTYAASAQPDLWVGGAMLGVVVLLTGARPYTRRDLAVAGLLIGLVSLLKPFYPVFLAVPGAVALVRQWRSPRAFAIDIAVLVVAWVATLAVMLGWLASRGVLDDFWDVHVLYSVRVYAGIASASAGSRIAGLVDFLLRGKVLAVSMPAVLYGFVTVWRIRRDLALALATLVAFGVFCVLLQAKFFPYHWASIFPALFALGAVGFDRALRTDADAALGHRLFALASLAVVCVHLSIRPVAYLAGWAAYMTGRQSESQYYGSFGVGWSIDPGEQRAVARYLQAHSGPEEPVAIWPIDAGLPYLAGRPPATRFTIPIIMRSAPESEITRSYRREYIARLHSTRPTYFVIGNHAITQGLAPVRPLTQDFPELDALLRQDYEFEVRIGDAELHRHRARPRPTAGAGT